MKKTVSLLLASAVTLSAFDAEGVYKKCAMCHGNHGEKVALNTSPKLNSLDQTQLETAIKAMLEGSSTISSRYLGMHQAKLKGVRTDDVPALSEYILTLK